MKKSEGRKLRRKNKFHKSRMEIRLKMNLNHKKQIKENKEKEKKHG